MKKVKKSDYEVRPRKDCEKPRAGSTAFRKLAMLENLGGICVADEIATQSEADALDYLQYNRLIVRMLRPEFDLLFPLVITQHKEAFGRIKATNKRIIVSANCWMRFKNSKISEADCIRKIDEVIENLVNSHMWEYTGGKREKVNLF